MSSESPDQPVAPAPPVRRTFLHVGSFKSGTSFLQSVLLRNRKRLAIDGVLYPTDHSNWGLQTGAAKELIGGMKAAGLAGSWSRLVDTIVSSSRSTAVVSVERLSLATPEQARALVAALEPTEVHAILTVRDLARVLPSDWQSKIKQGRTWSFDEYVRSAAEPHGSTGRANRVFWDHHDAVGIAKCWLEAVGPDRFHLVTVPPSGAPPSLLWHRFCSVLDVDPDKYDITQDAKSNFSLTYSDTEFLRQVNSFVGHSLDGDARKQWLTKYLANKVLRPSSPEAASADRPRLDAGAERWIEARSNEIVVALRDLDVDVVGDLDDLRPRLGGTTGGSSKPAIEFPDRASELVAALLRKLAEVDGSERISRRRTRRAAGVAGVATAPRLDGARRAKGKRRRGQESSAADRPS